ncbi:MAG: rhomboid family intramembrane serine protease [Hyphomicrobiales bacterium]
MTSSLFKISFSTYGVSPREAEGLAGLLFSPLIHGGWSHLMANSIPFLILSTFIFYFYRNFALRAFVIQWLLSGALLWIFGRSAWHIGASGVIYSMAAFLIVIGFIRKETTSLVISLLVIFLYGGLVWGVLPFYTQRGVSWDGHLFGAIAGIYAAYIYKFVGRKEGALSKDTEDEADYGENPYWDVPMPENETRKRNIKVSGENKLLLFLFIGLIVFLFIYRIGKDFL